MNGGAPRAERDARGEWRARRKEALRGGEGGEVVRGEMANLPEGVKRRAIKPASERCIATFKMTEKGCFMIVVLVGRNIGIVRRGVMM